MWWTRKDDKALVLGLHKHGFSVHAARRHIEAILEDPDLSFSCKVRMPNPLRYPTPPTRNLGTITFTLTSRRVFKHSQSSSPGNITLTSPTPECISSTTRSSSDACCLLEMKQAGKISFSCLQVRREDAGNSCEAGEETEEVLAGAAPTKAEPEKGESGVTAEFSDPVVSANVDAAAALSANEDAAAALPANADAPYGMQTEPVLPQEESAAPCLLVATAEAPVRPRCIQMDS